MTKNNNKTTNEIKKRNKTNEENNHQVQAYTNIITIIHFASRNVIT